MSIKLIVSDLDGSLLTPQEELPSEFFSLFKEMQQQGITFAVASGRQYLNILKIFAPIKDEIYIISDNGTAAFYRGEELLITNIPYNEMYQLIEHGRTIPNTKMILCGKEAAYMERKDLSSFEEVRKYCERVEVVDNLHDVRNDQFLKLSIWDPAGAANHSQNYFEAWKKSHKVIVSGNIWLDLMNKEAHKGVPLKMIQSKLGISSDETITFGDHLNDLEMLQCSYFSYAMSNAVNGIKKSARYIAPSNENKGVITVLRQRLGIN